jgi:hypothetical protein
MICRGKNAKNIILSMENDGVENNNLNKQKTKIYTPKLELGSE